MLFTTISLKIYEILYTKKIILSIDLDELPSAVSDAPAGGNQPLAPAARSEPPPRPREAASPNQLESSLRVPKLPKALPAALVKHIRGEANELRTKPSLVQSTLSMQPRKPAAASIPSKRANLGLMPVPVKKVGLLSGVAAAASSLEWPMSRQLLVRKTRILGPFNVVKLKSIRSLSKSVRLPVSARNTMNP